MNNATKFQKLNIVTRQQPSGLKHWFINLVTLIMSSIPVPANVFLGSVEMKQGALRQELHEKSLNMEH